MHTIQGVRCRYSVAAICFLLLFFNHTCHYAMRLACPLLLVEWVRKLPDVADGVEKHRKDADFLPEANCRFSGDSGRAHGEELDR